MKSLKWLVTGLVAGALWAFWWVQKQKRDKQARSDARAIANIRKSHQERQAWLRTLSNEDRLTYEMRDAQIRSYLRDQLGEIYDEVEEYRQRALDTTMQDD